MTSVWILGRGGLLGSSLARALRSKGIHEFIPHDPIPWENPTALESAFEKLTTEFDKKPQRSPWQIHIAFGVSTMASTEEDLKQETQTLQTFLLCLEKHPSLINEKGVISFASSAGAIYAGCTDDVITEASEPHPLNAYGKAKLEQEKIVQDFAKRHPSVTLLVARLSNLYGTTQSRTKKQGLLSHIARSILRHTPINIFVPFDTIRDYIHVDDAANAILQTVEIMQKNNDRMHTKIIASEDPVSIAQIIGTFKDITRIAPRVITSTSPLRDAYVHRIKFHSTVLPLTQKTSTSLLVGISQVMAAERLAMMRG